MTTLTLPQRHDPRLRLAAVIITLQVLGQTVLGFKLSIAQVLVTIAFCAALELAVTHRRTGLWVWPSSAILTGNSIAFFLRASGTQPGDWWSLNGIQYFLLAAAIGLGSKYLIRVGGRHLYNPSNIGLVAVLLLAGPDRVFPQYLWWGPIESPAVVAAWIVIIAGAMWVLWSLRMARVVVGFAVVFAGLIALLAGLGGCFSAVWRSTPVCGANYWIGIASSPEVAIFALLMMSDPRTTPMGTRGRAVYGASTAAVAAVLIGLQPTEWGIKVALLAALVIACTLVPLIERLLPAGADAEAVADPSRARRGRLARGAPALAAVVATTVLTVGVLMTSGNADAVRADRPAAGGGGEARQ